MALFLYGSGVCALVYQLVWLREFRLIFGVSTAASAAVLAIFMGGLGAGSLLLGARVDRSPRPLVFYARLEIAVAVSALATPLLLGVVREIYLGLGGSTTLGSVVGTVLRLVLAALVLAIPTVAMGGTLPAAARAVEDRSDPTRRGVGLLYGVNTLGAVTGCVLATFYLLEAFGARATLQAACVLNLAIALTAWAVGRRQIAVEPEEPSASAEAGARAAPVWFVLAGAATVGFAFFLMELVWYRMLGPILGGTVFTFGLVLAAALLGIGLGGAFYAAFVRKRPVTLAGLAATCLLEAAAIAIPFAVGDSIAILAYELRHLAVFGFAGHVAGWAVIAALVVLPGALVAGVQFPMLIALLGRGRRRVGREVGLAYAANTVGAIAGALAGGFGLIPALSATGCWRLVVLLLLILGLLSLSLSLRLDRRWGRAIPAGLGAVALVALVFAPGPTAAWRQSGIGAGRARLGSSVNSVHQWLNAKRRDVSWEVDGLESSVALVHRDGYAFIVNGKSDGNARTDAPTMVMSGVLAAFLHQDPKSALVIGLGTGATAGWLGAVPSIERVDVVELERAVLDVARACGPINEEVMDNPKVHVRVADGREALLTSERTYDVIVSEPSNPYRAGVASLFTREFYQAVDDRLGEGGLFLQWVQAYEVDAKTLHTVFATLASVFPHVQTWELHAGDLALVASRSSMPLDAAALRAKLGTEPFARAVADTWRATTLEGVLGRFVANSDLAVAVTEAKGVRINTDDRNYVEFDFARAVGRKGAFLIPGIRATALSLEANRPEVVAGRVDWERVAEAVADARLVSGVDFDDLLTREQRRHFSAAQLSRSNAKLSWARGHYEEAARAWRQQAREPDGPVELALLAESLARLGERDALGYVAELRSYQPVEADAILAAYCYEVGDLASATAALEAAFVGYRRDPWPSRRIMSRAIRVAEWIARRDGGLATRIYRALREPFAVRVLDSKRKQALARVSMLSDDTGLCVDAMELFEPYPVWTQKALLARAECYEINRHPLADRAWDDLTAFVAAAPTSFDVGLRRPHSDAN